MLGGLIGYARLGQATVITPFILAGAMSPVTLAAAIAQQNAEALAGIALTQGLTAACSATMPPVRLRQRTPDQPAASMRRARAA